MFKAVTFKMFNVLLNGSIEDCCETLLNGVPYGDMSFGQKIFTSLDIVDTLGSYYESTCPLFIDHIESMTYPIQSSSQLITLRAVDGVKKLQVKVEKEKAVA